MRSAVRNSLLRAVLGAVLMPVAVVVVLRVLGYEGGLTDGTIPRLWFVLPLAALGAGLVLALQSDVYVTPVATVVALLYAAKIGLFAGGPDSRTVIEFTAVGTFISVIGLLLFSIEFTLRNRRRVRRRISPVALRRALFVGIVHALVVVSIHEVVEFWGWYGMVEFWRYGARLWQVVFGSGTELLFLSWTFLGGVLLVAGPAYLLLRSRLVLPIGLVIPFSMYVAIQTVLNELARLAAGYAWGAAVTPLGAYLIFWFVPFAVLLLLGGVEYVVRDWLNLFPPRSLRASRPG